jgi:3-deoxy-D-manno-octulosonate 8-phosphate phosphatase (KDO 8-P phosphatase)
MKNFKEELKNIQNFVFDVDGVFTDGSILIHEDGSMLRTMNTKDGYAVKAALHAGFRVCIISGGTNLAVQKRLNDLGIKDVYLGVHDKSTALMDYLYENNLKASETLFMGDDIPDIPPMKQVHLATCPNDAVAEVRAASDYISHIAGGKGCVRDVIEQTLKLHGKWGVFFEARNDKK